LANFYLAFELDLPIIPVINKIDLKVAKPEVVVQQLNTLFDITPDQIIKVTSTFITCKADYPYWEIENLGVYQFKCRNDCVNNSLTQRSEYV